jgi:galactokinase
MISNENGLLDSLRFLYGNEKDFIEKQINRYNKLRNNFKSHFNNDELHYFSTPGRTELGGNHTDHNNGLVLAGSINLDSIAVVSKNSDNTVKIFSEGYDDPFHIDLGKLDPVKEETGTSYALIRGVASRLKQLHYKIGGFNAFISSDVLPGSGLSSSASIEVLIGSIFNGLYNNNSINPEILALAGQYAENNFMGKPSGLMDQMACAVGGIITIDFKDPFSPVIGKIDFDFDNQNYKLLVVDTGGNHADLTVDYSAVPSEMKSVAALLGKEVLREVSSDEFFDNILNIRENLGDRAVLRTLHFLQENDRVKLEIKALESCNFNEFLRLVNCSGNSSFKWLQNIYTIKNIKEQGISLALAISEKFIDDNGEGACRVHGGGFAGTIQVFLPDRKVEIYKKKMESIFGNNSVRILNIRTLGTVYLNELLNGK